MGNVATFESREQQLNNAIQQKVDKIRDTQDFTLPASDAPIVQDYIQKIEGTYDVTRAKKDTDNAVDLLYIAYNATPQEVDEVRNKISSIMQRLIVAQQKSELIMRNALSASNSIIGALNDYCPDWLDVKSVPEASFVTEVKTFLDKDFRELTQDIKEKADAVRRDLDEISATYDSIIKDTSDATSLSETALGKRLQDQKQLQKEINEANAERERLDSLVTDLQAEVEKFDKMAKKFESQADDAEGRAFAMSIIRTVAQTVSSALPSIAMMAAGPASFLAASSMSAISSAQGQSTKNGEDDNSAEVIRAKTEMTKKQSELKASERRRKELKQKIASLEKERDELLAATKPKATDDDQTDAKDASENTPAPSDTAESPEVAALNNRIAEAKTELEQEEDNNSKIGAALAGMQAALNQLDQSLSKMTDEQQSQAEGLRAMQMKMLDKVEAYEKERRQQAADLIKINALLKGQRTEEETLQLAIKSLNLSIGALKKTKEIVIEIAFFFQSFSAFMGDISKQTTERLESVDRVINKEQIRDRALRRLVTATDEFFIRQAAQWHAVTTVSDKFVQNFADGWSKLNKLSGNYLSGSELTAYLTRAADNLAEISRDRAAEADQKIEDLAKYREQA